MFRCYIFSGDAMDFLWKDGVTYNLPTDCSVNADTKFSYNLFPRNLALLTIDLCVGSCSTVWKGDKMSNKNE